MKRSYIIKIFRFEYKFILIEWRYFLIKYKYASSNRNLLWLNKNIFWYHIDIFYWMQIYFDWTKIYNDFSKNFFFQHFSSHSGELEFDKNYKDIGIVSNQDLRPGSLRSEILGSKAKFVAMAASLPYKYASHINSLPYHRI